VLVNGEAIDRLLTGAAVDVEPCDGLALDLPAGEHRLATTPGATTGIDVDRLVLSSPQRTEPAPQPVVSVRRGRTTRTATVTGCPAGCWLILGEGFNDGWRATAGGADLGEPRQISGGFNGWWLAGSSAPVTVAMSWAPQRTMWIGMMLAAVAVLGCAVLIWRDRTVAEMRMPQAAAPAWPIETVGRRKAVIAGAALTLLALVTISPTYGLLGAVFGLAIIATRRPVVAGVASVLLISGLAALIVRRQLRYHLGANPSWPAAFDDLHRLGLLAVALLLAATIVDECPPDQADQLT
jgi:arabinofuranan 3-O-arabinosyltransferase